MSATRALSARLAESLGLRILRGDDPPGATLPTEAAICADLKVSRTALREAMKILSAKGLITARAKVGTVVNARQEWNFFDPVMVSWLLAAGRIGDFLDRLFAFRQGVEPMAAALAARNAGFEDLDILHSAYRAMAAARDDFDAWVRADLRFHQAIYFATGNEFFWPVGRLLRPAFDASFRLSSSARDHQHCLGEHKAVFDAILARDADAARRAAGALLALASEDVARVLVGPSRG